jgi:uncharacterized membrane protein (UPF0136 family)
MRVLGNITNIMKNNLFSKSTFWVIFLYGVLIGSLGVYGYIQKNSIPSLVSGTIFGLILLLSSWGIAKSRWLGAYGALMATLCLTATFSYRYALTGKGNLAILSVLSAAIFLFLLPRFGTWKK